MRQGRREALAEGLADYEAERAEADALADVGYWTASTADPCCRDCGWLTYAKQELAAALRRAHAAGAGDEQPGAVHA